MSLADSSAVRPFGALEPVNALTAAAWPTRVATMKRFWADHPWIARVAALLGAGLAVCLLRLLAPGLSAGAEEIVADAGWRASASVRAERRLVLVDIDEASLSELGAWPWPRSTLARLAQRLTQAGVVVQGYDITFTDAREGDEQLAQAWARSSLVVGQVLSIDPLVTPRAGRLSGALQQPGCPSFAATGHGYYGTAESLLTARAAAGHITPYIESDGVVRKLPALVCVDGKAYASLALTMLWRAAQAEAEPNAQPNLNANTEPLAESGAKPGLARSNEPDWHWHQWPEPATGFGLLAPPMWLTSRSLPGLVVPLDARGEMRLPYGLDRRAFASVPASEVLRDGADLSVLKGAVVLVGATAFGVGDSVATPLASVASGLEVHAQSVVGLLDRRLPFTPTLAPTIQALAAAFVAVTLLLLSMRQPGVPPKRLPLAGLAMAALFPLASTLALLKFDLWLPWSTAALFSLLASVAVATVEHALTRAQRERLSAHLGAYLPAPVAQRLMRTDPSGQLQVEQRNITALVADIRNFSAFAAHRPPAETAALLHAYCCIAVDVVEQHGGVVENVAGDSILAVWNAYSDCPDHPQQAMAAAQVFVHATQELLASNQPILESSPVQPLALGIGLESGPAIVGTFGPSRRRAHAALGEPVSVAIRIQKMTADLSMPILVGPHLAASLPATGLQAQGEYLLEGLSRHYGLFAPATWPELVATDANWAVSVAAESERQPEAGKAWSGWADGRSNAVSSGSQRPFLATAPRCE